MGKFIVDLWLDGYEDAAEADKAAEEFIYEQLNMTASCVNITRFNESEKTAAQSVKPSAETPPLPETEVKR